MRLRRAELTWHDTEDETVVLDLQGSVYLRLNGSATVLWGRLAESVVTAPELSEVLVEQYEIDHDRAAADVDAVLDELRQRGLLEE